MAEFPGFEQRLLDCGVPREMAAEIAAEVTSTRQAFGFAGTLVVVRFLCMLPPAIVLVSLVYIAAAWKWGTFHPCGQGFWTSAHFLALLQWLAIQCGAGIIQFLILLRASRKTQLQYISARLMTWFLSGSGAGTVTKLIKNHPQCTTAEGLYQYLLRDWHKYKLSLLILLVLQTAVPAALFIIPLTC